MKKVAIAFWGTGMYLNFLPQWYERLEKYFLPKVNKHYFVLTDGDIDDLPENIEVKKIQNYGFPNTFYKTFEEYISLEKNMKGFDWFVSIDSDLYIQEEVNYDDFFDESKKYFGVHHPCHFIGLNPHNKFPGSYDRNPKSNGCVGDDIIDMDIYFQGCLWGGKIPHIFNMMKELDKWTKEDVERDTVPIYFEESYMNKWFLLNRKEVNILPPDYAYPEDFESYCNFSNKMMHLSKDNKKFGNNLW